MYAGVEFHFSASILSPGVRSGGEIEPRVAAVFSWTDSQTREKTMSETWYVYRYSLSGPVLKSPETELRLTSGDDAELALFALSGQTRPVEVRMVADPETGASRGEWRKNARQSFEFQWVRLGEGESTMLLGIASPKRQVAKRDFFVAIRSRRTVSLSPDRAPYDLRETFLTPLIGKALLRGGNLAIDRARRRILWRDPPPFSAEPAGAMTALGAGPAAETSFEIEDLSAYERGFKVAGRNQQGIELRLWVLPVDSTGALLATGYLHHQGLRESLRSELGDPRCTLGLHGC